MSIKVSGSIDPTLAMNLSAIGLPSQGGEQAMHPANQAIAFGVSPDAISRPAAASFDSASPQSGTSPSGTGDPGWGDLLSLANQLIRGLIELFAQQQGQGVEQDSASGALADQADALFAQPTSTAGGSASPEAPAPDSLPGTAQVASDATPVAAGSGPYTLNITNDQDHPIEIGQFDQQDKLVAELTLQPGEKGTMNYQQDTTGLLKQADSDGNYQPDASRLEFYNGFINTSDIDGRNAAIYATDGKGFEIGDTQSVADKAPSSIVSTDSAGEKTIAGYYDGSTQKMRDGGEFLTKELGTGMTYMHPDDDKLGEGRNPMRHTDSKSLNVVFDDA